MPGQMPRFCALPKEAKGFTEQQASEVLSNTDRFNEALITGLRRTEGVHPAELLRGYRT